ncbi:MAG TPA: glycosyltransferase family 2 protein [Methylomirabilota bacterium]|nr:glycosyltransferase family 2 protein [Methylomirabilota bacterium]
MPCLNEEETVANCVREAMAFLEREEVRGEVVVADNGSHDDSQRRAREAGARVIVVPDRGYGSALMGGIAAARGTFVILGDADRSYDFSNLGPFVDRLRAGCDLVVGNRFRGGIAPGAMPWLHRYVGNPILSGLGRLFFQIPVHDFHCGLRGLRKAAVERLDLRTTGMEFASEMIVKASLAGLRIEEVPTTLSPDGRDRPPHLRTWRDGWRHLRFMLLYSPRWLFLIPGLALMFVGLGLGAWLLPGPRKIGDVTFDIHTLLYAALAVLIGFQAVLFAVFTRIFAVTEGLMPANAALERLFRIVRLETGLIVGVVLVVVGLAGSIHAVVTWEGTSFGPLDPGRTFRTIIPSFLSLALGCQTILSSFFLSVLGLGRRRFPSP